MKRVLPSLAVWLPAGALLLFFFPVLVDFDSLLWSPDSDLAGQYLPYLDHLAAGERMPSRNPVPFAGIAATGNLNAPVAYPPIAVYLAWPSAWWLSAVLVAHLVLLAAGMARLARAVGISPGGAAFAAIAVALSPRVFGHVWAGHVFLLMAFAWTPWALHFARQLPSRPGRVLPLGLVLGMCLLTGFVQIGLYTVVASLLTAVAAAAGTPRPRLRRLLLAPALAGLAALFGCLVAAATLLPGALAAAESGRAAGLDEAFASVFSLSWIDLPGLVLPLHLGHPAEGNFWVGLNYWERCVYPGGAVVLFGLLGLFAPGGRRRWWLVGAAALAILFALGDRTPVFPLLFRALPGLDRVRVPARAVLFALPPLALLAARGFDAVMGLTAGERLRMTKWGLPALTGVLIAVTVAWSLSRGALVAGLVDRPDTTLEQAATAVVAIQRSLLFACAIQVTLAFIVRVRVSAAVAWRGLTFAVLAVMIAESWATGGRFVRSRSVEEIRAATTVSGAVREEWPDGRVLDRAEALDPATAQWQGIELAGGCDPLIPARYVRWFDLVADLPPGNPDARLRAETRAFDASWRVEYLADLDLAGVLTREVLVDPRFRRVREVRDEAGKTVFLFAYEGARWRVRAVGDWRTAENADEAREILKSGDGPVVEGAAPPGPGAGAGTTRLVAREPDLYLVDVEAPGESMLFVSESWSRAWTATVDSRPAPVHAGDLAFLAVRVPAGRHRVVLRAVRPGLSAGVLVSLVAGATLLMAAVVLARRSRRRRGAAVSSAPN